MARTYLCVPPEERLDVQALGACWDDRLKCWYICGNQDSAKFKKWLGDDDNPADDFTITSDEALVAAATVACWQCHSSIEVICIYCESGLVSEEPLTRFSVSCLWAVDSSMAQQLQQWPSFRRKSADGDYANHCTYCGAIQDDMYLHSEPDHVFFNIPRAHPASIKLTPLTGLVRMSGAESFEI